MSISQLRSKIFQFEQEFEQTYEQVKLLMEAHPNHAQSNNGHALCYFSQSLILDYEKNTSHLIIGSFHIRNPSNQRKSSPTILLKITSDTEFNFSGKFKSMKQMKQNYNFFWERLELDHLDPLTHYCLQPIKKDHLPPHDQLSFENFQIKIPLHASITVEGFAYFNHNNEGIPALNSINVST